MYHINATNIFLRYVVAYNTIVQFTKVVQIHTATIGGSFVIFNQAVDSYTCSTDTTTVSSLVVANNTVDGASVAITVLGDTTTSTLCRRIIGKGVILYCRCSYQLLG